MNKSRDDGVQEIANTLGNNFFFKMGIDLITGFVVAMFVAVLSTMTGLLVALVIGDKRNGTKSYETFRGLLDEDKQDAG